MVIPIGWFIHFFFLSFGKLLPNEMRNNCDGEIAQKWISRSESILFIETTVMKFGFCCGRSFKWFAHYWSLPRRSDFLKSFTIKFTFQSMKRKTKQKIVCKYKLISDNIEGKKTFQTEKKAMKSINSKSFFSLIFVKYTKLRRGFLLFLFRWIL